MSSNFYSGLYNVPKVWALSCSVPLIPGTEACLALPEAHPSFSFSQAMCYVHSRGLSFRSQTGDLGAAALLRAFMSL